MNTWTISKSSTSYRFLQRWSPRTLTWSFGANRVLSRCQYYTSLVLSILKVFGLALLAPCMLIGILLSFHYPVLGVYVSGNNGIQSPMGLVIIVAGLVGMITMILGGISAFAFGFVYGVCYPISIVYEWASKHLKNFKTVETETKPKKPSVLKLWYDDWKNQTCSIVEFTE